MAIGEIPVQLSKSQQEKLLTKVRSLSSWKEGRPCEVCSSTNWSVSDRLWELREYNEGNFVMGGPITPLVSLQCGTCGHVIFLNAITLGMVDYKTGKIVDDDKRA